MKVPRCRVLLVGEVSAWGKSFLSQLEADDLIELHYEAAPEKLAAVPAPQFTYPYLFVENTPDSKAAIEKIRASGKRFFLFWFGKHFSKEDLAFGIEKRVFCVLENARPDDRKVADSIRSVAVEYDNQMQFDQILRALKGLLLQAESDEVTPPLLSEIKTALVKLERTGGHNLLMGNGDAAAMEGRVPFQKSQSFAEALLTVNELERTGVLWVRGARAGEEGKVHFLQGKIVAAQAGAVRGLKAIHRIFLWDEPRFLFNRKEAQDLQVEENLDVSMKHLCEEGEQMHQRFQRFRREVPPLEIKLELEPSILHNGTALLPNEFSTLASVVEFNDVGLVLDYNPLPDVSIFEALINLRKSHLIRVAP